jgi:hypothetical protein
MRFFCVWWVLFLLSSSCRCSPVEAEAEAEASETRLGVLQAVPEPSVLVEYNITLSGLQEALTDRTDYYQSLDIPTEQIQHCKDLEEDCVLWRYAS